MYNLLFWVGVQFLLLYGLARITSGYRNRKLYKLVFAPAVIAEALLRLTACCLSAVSVRQVDFFEDGKPFVSEGESRIPWGGSIVFVGFWTLLVFLAFYALSTSGPGVNAYLVTLSYVDPAAISTGFIWVDARSYVQGLRALVATTDWSSARVWVLLYLVAGTIPFVALQWKHVQRGFILIAVLALVTFVLNGLGVRAGFLSRGWYLVNFVLPDHFKVFSLYMTALLATFVLHWTLALIGRSLRRMAASAHKAEEKKKHEKKSPRKEPAHA